MRKLHSAVLGLCALIESFPYSVESWMPPLTEGRMHPFRRYHYVACDPVLMHYHIQYLPNMRPIPLRFQRLYVTVLPNSRR